MDHNIDKECSALGGLFQSIVNDLKSSSPIWDDFACKATKLHVQIKSTIQAINQFLDSLQKIADVATNARGSTRDMGTSLTRICMRHRSIENRLKTFTSALIDCLVVPLQEKLDEWKRTAGQMEKDHNKDYKKHRLEIKKRSGEMVRLQKKVRKGNSGLQRMLDSVTKEVNDRMLTLLDVERNAAKQALIEQRSQFCIFVSWLKPVMDGELAMLSEIGSLDEVVELLCGHAADPYTLPPASEAVITDIKGLEAANWHFQTPPSSPSSSLGSRKSSFCSLSSGDSGTQARTLQQAAVTVTYQRAHSNPPVSPKFSSVSSQDSGFTSQDALCASHPTHTSPPPDSLSVARPIPTSSAGSSNIATRLSTSLEEETTGVVGDGAATPGSQQSTPSPSPSNVTWDGVGTAPVHLRMIDFLPQQQNERPHTISVVTGILGAAAKRPAVSSMTFIPPVGMEAYHRPQSVYSVASDNSLELENVVFRKEPSPTPASIPVVLNGAGTGGSTKGRTRPPLPAKLVGSRRSSSRSSECGTPTKMVPAIPDFSQLLHDQVIPQPIYMNMSEVQHAQAFDPDATLQRKRRPTSFVGTEEAARYINSDHRSALCDDDDPCKAIDPAVVDSNAQSSFRPAASMTPPVTPSPSKSNTLYFPLQTIAEVGEETTPKAPTAPDDPNRTLTRDGRPREPTEEPQQDSDGHDPIGALEAVLQEMRGLGGTFDRRMAEMGPNFAYCTLPRLKCGLSAYKAEKTTTVMPMDYCDEPRTPLGQPIAVVNRRHSMAAKPAPLPPTRRNSTITSATDDAPAIDKVRSRCTTPMDDNYGDTVTTLSSRMSSSVYSGYYEAYEPPDLNGHLAQVSLVDSQVVTAGNSRTYASSGVTGTQKRVQSHLPPRPAVNASRSLSVHDDAIYEPPAELQNLLRAKSEPAPDEVVLKRPVACRAPPGRPNGTIARPTPAATIPNVVAKGQVIAQIKGGVHLRASGAARAKK